jgi:AcrR family transcriptional regulator
MNVRTRTRREAERTVRRDYILQAVEQVFARRPFDEASMQEIAKQAGIGMHGLYRHFTSKQELYEEIVLARLDEIRERMAAAFRNADPTERLRIAAARRAQSEDRFVDELVVAAAEDKRSPLRKLAPVAARQADARRQRDRASPAPARARHATGRSSAPPRPHRQAPAGEKNRPGTFAHL